jgi:hypothetical protein
VGFSAGQRRVPQIPDGKATPFIIEAALATDGAAEPSGVGRRNPIVNGNGTPLGDVAALIGQG